MPTRTTDNRDSPNVFAIVPAAGRSRRMGRCKQVLEIDGVPMLLGMVRQLAASHIAGIVIVTRPEIEESLRSHPPAAAQFQTCGDDSSPEVIFAYNQADDAEMIDSVRIGIQTWKQRDSSAESDGLLVCPADHPGITAADFNACIAAFQSEPHRIIIASRNGRRGHPIIFPANLAAAVQSPACDNGLNALPRTHAGLVREVSCHSPGVLTDLDTPNDLTRR